MRVLYLGTPEFAVPTLERLLSWSGAEVVGLVTQPDRPAGRGKHIFAPPTKLVAEAAGIPVLQPTRLSKSPDTVQGMRDLKPDVLVMVAFGQILKQDVLDLAPLKVVNLHASLLPAYRGAAPINWSIIKGEDEAGVTTMLSDAGVDTGPMLLQQKVRLSDDMTAVELANTLSVVGAELTIKTLEQMAAGTIVPQEQDHSLATMAPRLTKEMGNIDWTQSSRDIANLIRGLAPWPGTFTKFADQTIKITHARVVLGDRDVAAPGTIVSADHRLVVACGDGHLEITEVQPANKAKMSASAWINGAHVKAGEAMAPV